MAEEASSKVAVLVRRGAGGAGGAGGVGGYVGG